MPRAEDNVTIACNHCCGLANWIELLYFCSVTLPVYTPPKVQKTDWFLVVKILILPSPSRDLGWLIWKGPKSVSTLDTSSCFHLTEVSLATSPTLFNTSPFPFICLHPSLALHQCWLILLFHYSLEVPSADAALRSCLALSAFLNFLTPTLTAQAKKTLW